MMDYGVPHTRQLDGMVASFEFTIGGRIGNMGPIASLRIFTHPPVPRHGSPILNPLNPTPKFGVKIGKCDTLMCE